MKSMESAATPLVAASGGDTVKLFDVSSESCILSYTPSPGFQLNCVKWNHTNLVVASAGEDKRISLWRKNGESLGTIPIAGTVAGDNIEESISAINFSNKSSRYICTGGSSQIVRIWDLQRKRCIKLLKGHTDTISGAAYNCKDEHLASVSLDGCLIIHNLASGYKFSEVRDPNDQVLRVLDYSRNSRHLLVTSGDDGSVHVWDTTGRSPKVSWLKQHSAPTAGLSFSPSNDKMIASVGLDKKLLIFDVGSRRPTFSMVYESPFSSLAFADDGLKLTAGTASGRIVLYDVRGKPQPLSVLNAGSFQKAVTSLCWSRSKPIVVKESNCTAEMALFGGATEDSSVMPDPRPSISSSSLQSSIVPQVRKASRFGPSVDTLTAANSGSSSSKLSCATSEDTATPSNVPAGRNLRRLRAPHDYNIRDGMEVFSPVVEVQPFSPSMWDELLNPSQKFSSLEDQVKDDGPVINWNSSLIAATSSLTSGLKPSGVEYVTEPTSPTVHSLSRTCPSITNWHGKKLENQETFANPSEQISSSSNYLSRQFDDDSLGAPLSIPSRLSSYAERISTTIFNDGATLSVDSPKNKKTGTETQEDILKGLYSRSNNESKDLPSMNGGVENSQKVSLQHGTPHGSSFTLQLFQKTLEETLSSFQKSIHNDTQNLHLEILRQSHMQEIGMSSTTKVILKNQSELMKEVQLLRTEMEQLRRLL